ncbi:unnamed protein product [Cylindrotheca closterium]|uniref:F-box domain-containing protein n=1 Tax=Cylindrotheca closterium TaxID=2856 RepID=A0AAD2G8X0_9STRA|nr:unnamed protein product [Cylindrotheca closterium]
MSPVKRKATVTSRDSKRPKNGDVQKEAVAVAKTLFGITDIVSQLFSFLDTRSLLKFSCLNKEFMSLLTYHHVVRAAMMQGGFGAQSLERLVRILECFDIWVPSPTRLLRIVCGKRCEKCFDSTRYVSASFGVFLCDNCIVTCTTPVDHGNKTIVAHKKAPFVCYGPRKGPWARKKYFIKSPMMDRSGEEVGPLITFQNIAEMIADNTPGLTPEEKVIDHMVECLHRRPDMMDGEKAILSAVKENKEEAEARKAAARESKANGQKRFGEVRKQRVDKLLDHLHGLVGDEVAWKSKLDERTHLLKAPSKVTRKRLREIPGEIQNAFDNRALMDHYIQRMVNFADHPEARRVLDHDWILDQFWYRFRRLHVHHVLGEPLKNPRALNEEDLVRLCVEVKKLVHRREACDVVLEKLVAKLDGVPFKEELEQNSWGANKWAYSFNKAYIHCILAEPLLDPALITNEKLDELAEKVRSLLERKHEVHRKVELLVQPTRKYVEWTHHLDGWRWNRVNNEVFFSLQGVSNEKARLLLEKKSLIF